MCLVTSGAGEALSLPCTGAPFLTVGATMRLVSGLGSLPVPPGCAAPGGMNGTAPAGIRGPAGDADPAAGGVGMAGAEAG
jgi:hypothetical protein